jgi:inorganic pyrophosphatase
MIFEERQPYFNSTFLNMDIIIETPAGRREKFVYDKEIGMFRLKKVLAQGLGFPFDFGFIPGTRGDDGDPLDAMVISEFSTFPGCLCECRIIGCIAARQKAGNREIINDRYLAIPALSQLYGPIHSIEDLPDQLINEIENFFLTYTKAEGKDFWITGRLSASAAMHRLQVLT